MAIVLVQKKSGGTNGAALSITLTYDAAPTQDNLLVAALMRGLPAAVTPPTGWSEAVQGAAEGGGRLGIWYKVAAAAELSAVTFVINDSRHMSLSILEYSGITTTTPLDRTASHSTGVNTVQEVTSGTTAATTQADELLVAAHGAHEQTVFGSQTNSFTEQTDVSSTGGAAADRRAHATCDRIVTTTGTFETTASIGALARAKGVIATFKASAASPTVSFDVGAIPVGF